PGRPRRLRDPGGRPRVSVAEAAAGEPAGPAGAAAAPVAGQRGLEAVAAQRAHCRPCLLAWQRLRRGVLPGHQRGQGVP
ncbi:unnamed protein product, partial [Prorocentrum cordatum]